MFRAMDSPFGTEEGAVLVAVERANGGELAPLQQVLGTLDSFMAAGSRPTPASFAESAQMLIELGLVEYVEDQLGLTPEGRKLLRRSGLQNDPRHVALVTALLQEFDERDVDERVQGEPPSAPTEDDVRRALEDKEAIEENAGGIGTPVIGGEVPVGSWLFGVASGDHWVPAVPPGDGGEWQEPVAPPPLMHSPARPLLDRLLRRDREERRARPDHWGGS
jgi:hypothetical protein